LWVVRKAEGTRHQPVALAIGKKETVLKIAGQWEKRLRASILAKIDVGKALELAIN